MQKDPTLSDEVQSYIATLDWEGDRDLPPKERGEARKNRQLVEFIVETTVRSREMITDAKLEVVEQLVAAALELIADFLDDYFTREVINAVPGYVERTLQLSRLRADRLPSNITNGYLKEAVRTYILGLPQASVALCRAALEQALKESLGLQLAGTFIRFQELLKEARKWNVLDGATEHMARDVANAGDEVMHEKPTDLRQAGEILTKARGLLQHIYSVEGKF
jgi:hypothetical protein